jgi:hypothetical protein
MFCPALTRSTEIAKSWFLFELALWSEVCLSPAGLPSGPAVGGSAIIPASITPGPRLKYEQVCGSRSLEWSKTSRPALPFTRSIAQMRDPMWEAPDLPGNEFMKLLIQRRSMQ